MRRHALRLARSFAALSLAFSAGTLLALASAAQTAPRIESLSPEVRAKGVRQVVARFSAEIVPLGDPRVATDAFAVDCPAAGRARWVTSSEWVYDFAADLPAGLRRAFTLKPGLKALNGALVGGRRRFAFDTGEPTLRQVLPQYGDVAEDQRFVLRANGASLGAADVPRLWPLARGRHELVLEDASGAAGDRVSFLVR